MRLSHRHNPCTPYGSYNPDGGCTLADDSTVVDPSGHRIALDNEHVRILEVRVPEGASLPLHSHPPRAVVAIGSYRLKSTDEAGHTTIVDRRPGEVVWSDGEDHLAEVLIGPVHAIEVEVKSARVDRT